MRWGVGRRALGVAGAGLVAFVSVTVLVSSGQASYPGRNGRIAFVWDPDISVRPQSCGDIFTITPVGSGRRRLTRGCPWLYSEVAYSASGKTIAFVRASEPFPRHLHGAGIYVMEADGSGIRRVTSSGLDQNPVISPDGRRVLFDRYANTTRRTQLFLASARGGHVLQLTRGPGAADATFSPDGHEIAFVGSRSNIFAMRLQGSRPRQLTRALPRQFIYYGDPDFSPNGRSLAIVCGEGEGFGSSAQICIMRADGTHLKHLTSTRFIAQDPAFSPDGRRIAFLAQLSCNGPSCGNDDVILYTMQIDGSQLRRVYNLGPNQNLASLSVSWQPLP